MLKRSCVKSLSSKLPKFWFCGVFLHPLIWISAETFQFFPSITLERRSHLPTYIPLPQVLPQKQTNKQTNKTSKVAKFQNISFNVYKFSRKWTRRSTPLQMWSQFGGCNTTTLPRTSARYLADLLRGQELHRKRNLEYSK